MTDNGETFGSIVGLRGSSDEYVPWSPEQAARAAKRFGVDLVDESGPLDEDGERSWEAFSLSRRVASGELVADVVQAVARAIDGVMALHMRDDAGSHGSYLWTATKAAPSLGLPERERT